MEYVFRIEVSDNPRELPEDPMILRLYAQVTVVEKDKVGQPDEAAFRFSRRCCLKCAEITAMGNWSLPRVDDDPESYKRILFEILKREVKADLELNGPGAFQPDPSGRLKEYEVAASRYPTIGNGPPFDLARIDMSPGPYEATYEQRIGFRQS